jgi:hypothetical protein
MESPHTISSCEPGEKLLSNDTTAKARREAHSVWCTCQVSHGVVLERGTSFHKPHYICVHCKKIV